MISNRYLHILIAPTLLVFSLLACRFPQSTPALQTDLATTLPANPATPSPVPSQASSNSHSTAVPTVIRAQISHRISTHRIFGIAEFYDQVSMQKFIPRGANYQVLVPVLDHYEDRLFMVGIYDHSRTLADFSALSAAGYNTVRIILDGCAGGKGCVGAENGQGLNPAYLDNIVDLMNLARESNLLLLLAVSDLPEAGGYANLAMAGVNQDEFSTGNAAYLTSAGIQAAGAFWNDLLTGLIARQAPFDAVLGWELQAEQSYQLNEPPFSLDSGRVTIANRHTYDVSNPAQKKVMALDGLRYYIDRVKQAILAHDPMALVSMGFRASDAPDTRQDGELVFVDTRSLLSDSSLDFLDLHAYPGEGMSMDELAQKIGMSTHVTKPVLMGEVGAYTWTYPQLAQGAIAVQDWIAASCASGFSGWLYQGYYPSPAGLSDATWGFVDGSNTILNALAPIDQPDACTTTILPGRNLALGKPVSVSAALPDQSPQMTVDGDPNTQWSAGDYPTQWIEIDLGSPATIGEIHLTVGQWPAGDTVHQLWVGASPEAMLLVHEFEGREFDFDVLSFVPKSTLSGIRYVRVITLESPSWVSWREIEVFAPYPATPTPIIALTITPEP